jgi:predicted double-glycine peptidase
MRRRSRNPIPIALISLLALLAQMLTALAVWAIENPQAREAPSKFVIEEFPREKQLPNYCGPTSLAAVLRFWGQDEQTQQVVGKCVFDAKLKATNGADMLLYARNSGLSAYSFNGNLEEIKSVVASGVPVIVLQDTSKNDKSGHFRVIVGFDDRKRIVHMFDPYEVDRTRMSYSEFSSLWLNRGNWGLIVMPKDKDAFVQRMDARNPVVHLDLAQVYFRKGSYDDADREIRLALQLEPSNGSAKELQNQIETTRGASGR